jgi:hypothetical protein
LRKITIASLLLWIGCGGAAPTQTQTVVVTPPPPLEGPPFTWPLQVAATSGSVKLNDADFSLDGNGTARFGSLAVSHGQGQLEIDGRIVPAATWFHQSFPPYDLYQTIAVEPDRIWVLWFYCESATNLLRVIFYEGTDGTPMTPETASGTCDATRVDASTVQVRFPAVSLPPMTLPTGFSVDGSFIKVTGGSAGAIFLGKKLQDMFVFSVVDCTACGTPGWTELHSLFWEPIGEALSFSIVYLQASSPRDVLLEYSLTLPGLTDPAEGLLLPATWTLTTPRPGASLLRPAPL